MKSAKSAKPSQIQEIYETLYDHFGPQNWWPGDTRFEVIVGAILTQNTAWQNVKKAIENLKREGLLTPGALHNAAVEDVQECIRPAGYFRVKTKRLKHFMNFLFEKYSGDLDRLFSVPTQLLREELLNVNGIGEETADSIILYAGGKLSFVIDAYTRRIFSRQGIIEPDAPYGRIKKLFEDSLPEDIGIYNEYHALIVRLGKDICKTKPLCSKCPLPPCSLE